MFSILHYNPFGWNTVLQCNNTLDVTSLWKSCRCSLEGLFCLFVSNFMFVDGMRFLCVWNLQQEGTCNSHRKILYFLLILISSKNKRGCKEVIIVWISQVTRSHPVSSGLLNFERWKTIFPVVCRLNNFCSSFCSNNRLRPSFIKLLTKKAYLISVETEEFISLKYVIFGGARWHSG